MCWVPNTIPIFRIGFKCAAELKIRCHSYKRIYRFSVAISANLKEQEKKNVDNFRRFTIYQNHFLWWLGFFFAIWRVNDDVKWFAGIFIWPWILFFISWIYFFVVLYVKSSQRYEWISFLYKLHAKSFSFDLKNTHFSEGCKQVWTHFRLAIESQFLNIFKYFMQSLF